MSKSFFFISGWVAAIVGMAPGAWAAEGKTFPECERIPTEREVAAAKGAFEAGQVSFQEADYDRAILYWEDAFRRDCTALALLLNLARAYELSGQRAHAVSALETYLARRPSAADRDQITRRIEVLKEQIEQERRAAAPAASSPGEQPAKTESSLLDEDSMAPPEERAEPPLWPLFVAGGGVVVAGVGAVLWATADQSAIDRCTKVGGGTYQCPTDEATDAARSAQRQQGVGMGLTIGGGALAIGGTVTYFVLRSQMKESAIAPSFGPGFAGISYAGTF